MLSKRHLLEAVNTINFRDGGTHMGTMGEFYLDYRGQIQTGGSYTNQHLVRAALEETAGGYRITFGFCQSQIGRAPSGGFPLEIPQELLALCRDKQDVLAIWQAMQGNAKERMARLESWLTQRNPLKKAA